VCGVFELPLPREARSAQKNAICKSRETGIGAGFHPHPLGWGLGAAKSRAGSRQGLHRGDLPSEGRPKAKEKENGAKELLKRASQAKNDRPTVFMILWRF
jgi:hypothetical protein